MSTNFGDSLNSLIPQPGATFTITRAGFDTGSRTFKCDASVARSLAPERGTQDDTYPEMRVDNVTITEDRNDVAMLAVSYLGSISGQPKEDQWEYTVNYEPNGLQFTTTINGNSVTVDTSLYHPQVTRTYVSAAIPAGAVGDYITPAKFSELVPPESFTPPGTNQVWTYTFAYRGWRLVGRTIRENTTDYEVTDTFNYDFQVLSVTVT